LQLSIELFAKNSLFYSEIRRWSEKHSPTLYGKDTPEAPVANEGAGQQLKGTQMNIT
jgi:hypothetical protein